MSEGSGHSTILKDVTRTNHRSHIHVEDSLLVLLRLPLGTKIISESRRKPFRLRTDFFPSDSTVPTWNERNKVAISCLLLVILLPSWPHSDCCMVWQHTPSNRRVGQLPLISVLGVLVPEDTGIGKIAILIWTWDKQYVAVKISSLTWYTSNYQNLGIQLYKDHGVW